MPRRDGTGPEGTGANTGRGLGPCGSNQARVSQTGSKQSKGDCRNRGLGRAKRRGAGQRQGRNER